MVVTPDTRLACLLACPVSRLSKQISVEDTCFRLVIEADSQGASVGGAGGGGGTAQEQGRSRRRERERSGASSSSSSTNGMGFLVANFLSEQARTNRTQRMSDLRSDMLTHANAAAAAAAAGAAPGGAGAADAAGAATAAFVHAAQAAARRAVATEAATAVGREDGGATATGSGSRASPAPAEGRQGTGGGSSDGAGSSTTPGGSLTISTPGTSAAAAAMDAPTLVLSCIRRAEALLPGGVAGTGAGVARPGLGGILHVLLLLATGVTEAQRGALVTSGFHLKVCTLFGGVGWREGLCISWCAVSRVAWV